jgi:hypothetical protein
MNTKLILVIIGLLIIIIPVGVTLGAGAYLKLLGILGFCAGLVAIVYVAYKIIFAEENT